VPKTLADTYRDGPSLPPLKQRIRLVHQLEPIKPSFHKTPLPLTEQFGGPYHHHQTSCLESIATHWLAPLFKQETSPIVAGRFEIFYY
jgi:hypothetical protein